MERVHVEFDPLPVIAAAEVGLRPDAPLLEGFVLDKHFERKHGPGAYYGQN